MNWLINLFAKLSGAAAWFHDAQPLLLAAGSALTGAAGLAVAVGGANSPAEALAAVKNPAGAANIAAITAGVGAIFAHFKRKDLQNQHEDLRLQQDDLQNQHDDLRLQHDDLQVQVNDAIQTPAPK